MSTAGPDLPTTAELEAGIGRQVLKRVPIRDNGLSVTERIFFSGGEPGSAVLKTTVADLRAEADAHRKVSGLVINAARLFANSGDSDPPWLLIEDLGEASPNDEPTVEQIGDTLETLAQMHAISAEWSGFEDRSLQALLEPEIRLNDLAFRAIQSGGPATSETAVDALATGMALAARTLQDVPLRMVHGDLDPGNLFFTRGHWRAFDWGLAHLNVPLVDVAHMVMRFDEQIRSRLTRRYLGAISKAGLDLKVSGSISSLIEAANVAHMAFFIWWHSHCVVNLGIPPETYRTAIGDRLRQISEYAAANQ